MGSAIDEGPPGSPQIGPRLFGNQYHCTPSNMPQVYAARWGKRPQENPHLRFKSNDDDVLVNEDIATVEASEIPCTISLRWLPLPRLFCGQDAGQGNLGWKEGVLWWEIHRIAASHHGQTAFRTYLENVDNAVTTWSTIDFDVMLASLDELGYMVEWRVVDASSYDGFPQRRKRVFILAHRRGTPGHEALASGSSRP